MASHKHTPKHPTIKVRWPITIYTEKGPVEGEARNITGSGIFIHCKEQLRQNERCLRMPCDDPVALVKQLVLGEVRAVEAPAGELQQGLVMLVMPIDGLEKRHRVRHVH